MRHFVQPRPSRASLLHGTGSALVALAALSGVRTTAQAASPATVNIGILATSSDAPIFIADQKGYFKDEGIAIAYHSFMSAAVMMAPLGAGQLDIAAGGTSAGLFNAVTRGIEMRVVADKASDPPGYGFAQLLVRTELMKSGRYKTLADIKGMKIAISAPGSSSWPELAAVCDKAGVSFDDVTKLPLDYPDHVVGFKSGSIDASITIEPFATAAINTGDATKIMGDDQFYPNQEVAVLIYGETFRKQRRDVGMRFMRAYIKGARYYNDALANGKLAGPNAADVISILTEKTRIKNPAVFRAITPNGCDPDGRVNVASMQRDLDLYRKLGLVTNPKLTAAQTVDTSFTDAAVKQLGPYKPR
jgi:NitT/TauT family transport system substrate-binding protein